MPKCINSIVPHVYNYWAAGISPYINGVWQAFQWTLFPGVVRQLKPTTPWGFGEPNSSPDGIIYCIHQSNDWDLDDNLCANKICVLCEIGML